MARASTAPKSGPTSGEVRKSPPRRPADPRRCSPHRPARVEPDLLVVERPLQEHRERLRAEPLGPLEERHTYPGNGAASSARSPSSPTMPGATPKSSVTMQQIAERAGQRRRHLDRGAVLVGHRLHPHRLRDAGVVEERDHRVDADDDGEHVARRRPRVGERLEDHELGEPAAERRDAGQGEEEHRHQHGEAGGVGEQPAVARDLAGAGLAGDGQDDGEGAEVHGAVDQQVDHAARRSTRCGADTDSPATASGARM